MLLNARFNLQALTIIIAVGAAQLYAQIASNRLYGFDAISLNGAGRAIDLENSTTSGNAASIGLHHTESYEAGITGFAAGPGLHFSWLKSISNNSAINASYSLDPLTEYENHSMAISIALAPLKKLSFGVTGLGQLNSSSSFLMDFSGGLQYRHNKFFNIAADVRSLFETLDSTSARPYTQRTYGLGTSYTFGQTRTFIVGDIAGESPLFKSPVYSLGAGTIAGTNDNLKVTTGINLFEEENTYTSRINFGLKMQEKFFGMLMNAHYAIQDITLKGLASKVMAHSIGFGVILDAFVDKTPPEISVRLDKGIILLNAETADSRAVHFQLSSKDTESKIKLWHLIICSIKEDFKPAEVVKSFSGKGISPKTIRWEGRGTDNERLPSGVYTYRFIVADEAENVNKTTWQLIEIQ